MKYIDLSTERFGRLLVLKDSGRNKWGAVMWECICDCGNYHTTNTNMLKSGKAKSCGCLNRERASERMKKFSCLVTRTI